MNLNEIKMNEIENIEGDIDMNMDEEDNPIIPKSSNTVPFVSTLFSMIQEKSNEQYIHWCAEDDGKSFIIEDAILFSKELLPKYYKHTNFCGFTRQLSLYGFKKFDGVYRFSNDNFQSDRNDLLKSIQRKKPQSQRKKQNNTTTLYQQLLTQLMALQKQNLDTNQQINTLKETLYGLKLREENLEMRMQRLQDTLSIDQNAFMFFSSNPSQFQRMNEENNTNNNSNTNNNNQLNNNQNNNNNQQKVNRENANNNNQQNENQSQNQNFMSWNDGQNPSQLSWKF